MLKSRIMNKREEKLMNYLWESDEPRTVTEIEQMFSGEKLSRATVFKAVQSLTEKGLIRVGGVERTAKTYARRVEPAVTREEYAAILLSEKGIDKGSLKNLVLAMLGAADGEEDSDERVIKELEGIISEIRGRK